MAASGRPAKAKKLKQEIDRGADPLPEERERREAPDVRDLCERYLREWVPRKSPHEQKRDCRMIEQDVLPQLGRIKTEEVTRDDIDRLHRRVGQRAPVRANRVLSILSKAFNLAETWNWRSCAEGNPTSGIARNPEVRRERFLSIEEIGRLMEELNKYLPPHEAKPYDRYAVACIAFCC
jgi:integrase